MNHTPGPWSNEGDYIKSMYGTICDCRYKNGKSDAILIAAAPDLYEACKALDAWWHSPRRNSQTLEAVICSAKDAIAKAEETNDRT